MNNTYSSLIISFEHMYVSYENNCDDFGFLFTDASPISDQSTRQSQSQ